MILDSFLIALGVKADVDAVERMDDALDNVEGSANRAEAATESFGVRFGRSMFSAMQIVAGAFSAVQGAVLGAWAYLNSYIDKAEELYNSKDADIRITKEQYEMSKRYRESMEKTGKIIDGIRTNLAFAFLPTMLKLAQAFESFLDANKELIASGLSKVLTILYEVGEGIINVIKFIDMIITNTIGWKNTLIALGAIFTAVFATNPVFLIIAAITALFLLIDDLMTYMDGGDSLFGEYWQPLIDGARIAWSAIKAVWDFISEFVVNAIDLVKNLADFWIALWNGNTDTAIIALQKAQEAVGRIMKMIGELMYAAIVAAVNMIISYAPKAWSSILDGANAMVRGLGNIFSGIFTIVTTPFKMAFDWIVSKFSDLPSMLGNIIKRLPVVGNIAGAIGNIGSAINNSNVRNRTNNITNTTQANINISSPNPNLSGTQVQRSLNAAKKNVGSGVTA